MAATTPKAVYADRFEKLQSVVDMDCWFQAPGKAALHVVLTDAGANQPQVEKDHVDYAVGVVVQPGAVWGRSDTLNRPEFEGEIWVRADQDATIPWTE